MSDTALEKARKKRHALVDELQRLDHEMQDLRQRYAEYAESLAEVDDFIRAWFKFAEESPPSDVPERSPEPRKIEAPRVSVRPKNPDKEDVLKEALAIIDERGAPVPRKELFDALQERGVIIHGKNPEMVLSTMLWRQQEDIVRLKPYGYWPANRPYEPAKYDPELPFPDSEEDDA